MVYAETLSECFRRSKQVHYDSFWSNEDRSLPTRLITRLASLRIPGLSAKERDLDLGRLRIEWSHGRMTRILVSRKLRQAPYDVLYFHTQVLALGAASLMRNVPSIISLDMTACQVAQGLRFPATVRPIIDLERRAFEATAHIVAFSSWAGRSVIEDYGVAPEKVTVIGPAVRFWQITPVEIQARPMRRILFVGSDFTRKGGWDLLDTFKKNFSNVAELHLITTQRIEDAGKNVFVHHGVKAYSPEWQALMSSADIFAMPSYFEGSPLVFAEANAFGAAVIGTNICGIPQMVRDGENGFLIEPGNRQQLEERLGRLIEDDDLRLRFRRRSRELALEEFDAEKNARRLGELFEAVKR
jgi:glycosyltransferase involved in cell wall biosynthesis